jgi:hypothetical protein
MVPKRKDYTMSKNETERVFTVSETVLDEVASEQRNTRFQMQASEGIVNPMVLADVLEVRPQMIYGYIRKGKIPTVSYNNTQKKVIPLTAARDFARLYLQGKVDRAARQAAQDELTASAEEA